MIETEMHERVAVVRMCHGKVNALDIELLTALYDELEELKRTDAEAVVLTGTGSVFSAGADLQRTLRENDAYAHDAIARLGEVFVAWYTYPTPVVAAINGHAIAGGCILACTADRRVMASGAGKLGLTELAVGVPYPYAGLEIMRSVVGGPRLDELVWSAELYDDESALSLGLVHRLVPPETLLDEALAEARRLTAIPPATFTHTKRALRASTISRIAANSPAFDGDAGVIWGAGEARDAMRRFVEQLRAR